MFCVLPFPNSDLFMGLKTCFGGTYPSNQFHMHSSCPLESKADSKTIQAIALGIAQMSTVELSSCGKSISNP